MSYKLTSVASSLVLVDILKKFITRNEDILCFSPVFSGRREFNMDKNRAPQCRGQGDQKDG